MFTVTNKILVSITFIVSGLSGCSLLPRVQTDVNFNQEMNEPPYYNSNDPLTGQMQHFNIQLDLNLENSLDSALPKYLSPNLENINQYLDAKFESKNLTRLPIAKSNSNNIVRFESRYVTDSSLHAFEVPKVNYGNPAKVIDNYSMLYSPEEAINTLTVVDGMAKWQEQFQKLSMGKKTDLFLDIRLGLIEIVPVDSNGAFSVKEHRIGTGLAYSRGNSSDEYPINVVAFKGIVYNRDGRVIKAGVEGFLPIYPDDGLVDLNLNKMVFGQKAVHLNTRTSELAEFDSYPWKSAIDHLLDNLTPKF